MSPASKGKDSTTKSGDSSTRKHKKRCREKSSGTTNKRGVVRKKRRQVQPFKGMILAVSTMDVKGQAHSESLFSYKSVADLCRTMGASVSGQLHGRVTCPVCNRSAVQNATQRVRKALKRNVSLVDVAWVKECHKQQHVVSQEPFLLDSLAAAEMAVSAASISIDKDTVADADIPESLWSEPTSLGCCCVCHENGDTKCPWCLECNIDKKSNKS